MAIFFLVVDAASAQLIFNADKLRGPDDPFLDQRLIGVRERHQPQYEPTGLKVGSQIISSAIGLETEYNDNILANDSNIDDIVVTMQSKFGVRSKSDEYAFRVEGKARSHRSMTGSQENSDEYEVRVNSEISLAREYSLQFIGQIGRHTELRTQIFSSRDTLRPATFVRSSGSLSIQKTAGRLLLQGGVAVRETSYDRGTNASNGQNGGPEPGRVRTSYRPFVQAEHSFSPDTAIFASFNYNRRAFSGTPAQPLAFRNSKGFQIGAGLRLKLTPLIEITTALGYLERKFQMRSLNVSGLLAEAKVRWLPTMLTTIHANFSRQIAEDGSRASGNIFVNRAEIGLDQELLRNLVLNFSVRYQSYDFRNRDRKERRLRYTAGMAFRPNRSLLFTARYRKLNHSSGFTGIRDYDQSRFSLSLTFAV